MKVYGYRFVGLDFGTVFDRYGIPNGRYVSTVGIPYGQRAL